MYQFLIRPILFLIDAERVHVMVTGILRTIASVGLGRAILKAIYRYHHPRLEKKLLGLTFPNPVGMAAGFDKDAALVDELDCLGFGFIEIGTLTPKAQSGNEKPRLFRLPKDQALINRMGFNNKGVLDAVARLKKRASSVVVGGNIGKNKATPNDKAFEDYIYCFEALYDHVDYFVVNVSSPNTPGLRSLQEKEPLRHLLSGIKKASAAKPVQKPVLLKIAPDLSAGELDDVVDILKTTGTDGVVATNTTIARKDLLTDSAVVEALGAGGVSGKPLKDRSTEVIRYLRTALGPGFPIIGVGGIMSPQDALEKLRAGADLVQVYTGFIYEGPGFVKSINKKIAASLSE